MNLHDIITRTPSANSKVSQFHGHTRIDLMRNGKVVHRVEKDNTVTAGLQNLVNATFLRANGGVQSPFTANDYFAGCFLLPEEIDTSSGVPTELPSTATLTAHAGQTAYSGDVLTRGNPNATESGIITNGYRYVWDWATSQGNGIIKSVCLTHDVNGYNGLYTGETGLYLPTYVASDVANSANWLSQTTVGIYSPEEDVVYTAEYSSDDSAIIVKKIRVNQCKLHLNADSILETHTISTSLDLSTSTASFGATIDSGYLYCILPYSKEIKIVKINLSDWTSEDIDLTVTETVTVETNDLLAPNASYHGVLGDYVYIMPVGKTVIYKINMTNSADITELENVDAMTWASNSAGISFYHIGAESDQLFGVLSGQNVSLIIQGDKFYRAPAIEGRSNYKSLLGGSVNGMLASIWSRSASAGYFYCQALSPLWISTVNNLSESVTKTADLTMKLTYEITEVE